MQRQRLRIHSAVMDPLGQMIKGFNSGACERVTRIRHFQILDDMAYHSVKQISFIIEAGIERAFGHTCAFRNSLNACGTISLSKENVSCGVENFIAQTGGLSLGWPAASTA